MERKETFYESYPILFRAVTKALEQIDAMDIAAAHTTLIKGQRDAEEAFISAGESCGAP